ncbi:hypothetical protein Asppvi_008136 [Aspergillus pseudoviridinutans]|uniref:Rhodopsin domain-containing protein n=1 Tax=Aspergillus pseudoviridinutans TaxID=1517512 RepID=A0A9P3BDA3_9EURO|nr:uncharacterized protein Asppvi_008136 [Aspergillus pseudoviridinutans]GIJ89206.1 hypothetical protein Asppvi_008136 [Aspergillus pseudoviridinutans]
MLNGRSEAIVTATSVFLALSLVTVGLRCFVRARIVRAFGLDDWTMVAAMALNLGFAICTLVGCSYGMGQKTEDILLHPGYYRRALLCWWLGQVFYIITCVVAKMSIIISLLRITIDRAHILILYAAMGLTLAVGLLFFFFTIFECKPVDYFWNRFTKPGSCIDTDILIAIAYTYSVGAAVADFTIGILPIFIIWSLRMNARTKMAIAGILGIGCIASAAVIVRIPFIHSYKDPDFFYATYQISIWSNVEAGLGITAGSLTTLRPLVRFLRDGSSASRSHQRQPSSFPLSSNMPKGISRRSKPEEGGEDSRRLWTGMATDEYQGVTTTVITGTHPTKRGESEESLTG